jgi:uncharacterized membrane protein YkoI
MKKKSILILVLSIFCLLFLSGCTVDEIKSTANDVIAKANEIMLSKDFSENPLFQEGMKTVSDIKDKVLKELEESETIVDITLEEFTFEKEPKIVYKIKIENKNDSLKNRTYHIDVTNGKIIYIEPTAIS